MYAPQIVISFGDKEKADIHAVLGSIAARLDDFRPLWKKLRPIIAKAFATNFATESAISGMWPPLTPKYLAWKLKQGYPADILVRTRELITACVNIGDTAGANQIMIDEPMRFAFGVTLDYSWYHDREEGVHGKRREHLALIAVALDEIDHAIAEWTYDEVGRIWKGEEVPHLFTPSERFG